MNIGTVSRLTRPAGTDPGNGARADEARPAEDARVAATSGEPAASESASARVERTEREARVADQQADLSRESLERLVERISQQISIERRSLSFTVNDELGRTIVKVIDRETDEVIRQIPSEELVRFAEAINSINEQRSAGAGPAAGTGLLIQEKA